MLALVLRSIFGWFPEFALQFYQNFIFQFFRRTWDNSLGLIPFPLFYLLVICLIIFVLFKYRRAKKVFSLHTVLPFTLNSLGFLLCIFLLFWGFNYTVPGVAQRNNIQATFITDEILIENYYSLSSSLEELRNQLPQQIITEDLLDEELEDKVRSEVEHSLEELGYTISGKVRCRFISSNGWMRRIGITGIYFPFVGEAHCDASQASIPLVFTLAHELSHGYGVTDEGEANFIAWHSLYHSKNLLYRYIAGFELMKEILIEIRNRDYDHYLDKRDELPFWVKEDLNFVRQNALSYPPLFPKFSYAMNDAYLKSQGVSEGIDSYDEMLNLVLALKTNTKN